MNSMDLAIIALEVQISGAESLSELSDLIYSGRSTIALSPAARYCKNLAGKKENYKGSFLSDIFTFDYQAFNLTKDESIFLDPQQRIMLEIASKALDQVGLSYKEDRNSVGVFIGGRMNSYGFEYGRNYSDNEKNPNLTYQLSAPLWGRSQNFLAAWIADRFNLAGPALVIDTACSSSLSALWTAAQALINKECEVALVGGVDLLVDSLTFDLLEKAGALSKSGYCRPLDQRADGYLPGEGAVSVVLKPMNAALRDGDEILACLKHIHSNNDGATMGVTTPNIMAQQELIERTYASGMGEELEYIELHGTGTSIGDPIEVDALNRGLSAVKTPKHSIAIGSIKQQIGHLHSVSGLVGLAKIVAIAQNKLIPSFEVEQLNQRLNLDKTYFELLKQPRKLTTDKVNFAVSSFGFGGTNVHAVIQSPAISDFSSSKNYPFILPLSAPSAAQLRDLVAQWVEKVETKQASQLYKMCFGSSRKKHLEHRIAITAKTPEEISSQLKRYLCYENKAVVPLQYSIQVTSTSDGATIKNIKYLEEINSDLYLLANELTQVIGMNLNQLENDLEAFAELCIQTKLIIGLGIPIENVIFPPGCSSIGEFVLGHISLMEALNSVASHSYSNEKKFVKSEAVVLDVATIVSTAESIEDVRCKLAEFACIAYKNGATINWKYFYNDECSSLSTPQYQLDGQTLELKENSRRQVEEIDIKVITRSPEVVIEATISAGLDLITQHLVYGINILPGVAWFSILHDLLAKVEITYRSLENIRFLSPLIPLPTTKIICHVESSGNVTIYNEVSRQKYFSALLVTKSEQPPEPIQFQEKLKNSKILCSGTSTYRWLRRQGYTHGRYYRNISFIALVDEQHTIARLESSRCSSGLYSLNPGLLDAMTISAINPTKILDSFSCEEVVVPFSVDTVQFYRSLKETAFVYTKISSYNSQGYRTTQTLLTELGEVVAVFTNLASKSINVKKLEGAIHSNWNNDKEILEGNISESNLELSNIENSEFKECILKEENLKATQNLETCHLGEEKQDYLLEFLTQAGLSYEDAETEFLEVGFDSKSLVELSDRLSEEWSISLYPTIFFEYPTPKIFVEGFLQKNLTNKLLLNKKKMTNIKKKQMKKQTYI